MLDLLSVKVTSRIPKRGKGKAVLLQRVCYCSDSKQSKLNTSASVALRQNLCLVLYKEVLKMQD